MLLGASICPHPPVLVAGVCRRDPAWLVEVRDACVSSVRRLTEAGPERVVAVGAGPRSARWDGDAGTDLRRFGIEGTARASPGGMPLSLTVAAWLLDAACWTGPREFVAIVEKAGPQECAETGRALVEGSGEISLLTMGDGSAKRTRDAPGSFDERAAAYDAKTLAALAAADPGALLALDPELASELWVAGREALQVLAGAATVSPGPDMLRGLAATVRYNGAPRGVCYAVADWTH